MRRGEIGTRWRRLTAGRQALLALAHLRCGDTYAQLAAGFGIGVATVYRYIREAVEVPADLAPTLVEVMHIARAKAFVILDGTLLPIDRIAADTPYYSGKHRRHGMNVQVLADPFGRLLWASPALPGSTHGLTAARTHGIVDALTEAGLKCWADKAYRGAELHPGALPRTSPQAVAASAQQHARQSPLPQGCPVIPGGRATTATAPRRVVGTPEYIQYSGVPPPCDAPHPTPHADPPGITGQPFGEQAMATLKGRRLLRKLRCSTNRVTAIVQAVLVLHHAST